MARSSGSQARLAVELFFHQSRTSCSKLKSPSRSGSTSGSRRLMYPIHRPAFRTALHLHLDGLIAFLETLLRSPPNRNDLSNGRRVARRGGGGPWCSLWHAGGLMHPSLLLSALLAGAPAASGVVEGIVKDAKGAPL